MLCKDKDLQRKASVEESVGPLKRKCQYKTHLRIFSCIAPHLIFDSSVVPAFFDLTAPPNEGESIQFVNNEIDKFVEAPENPLVRRVVDVSPSGYPSEVLRRDMELSPHLVTLAPEGGADDEDV